MFDIQREELNWCGRDLVLETGRIARQADGAVFASWGETTVLAPVVALKTPKPGVDFFPLTVNYQEKAFAAGRIPGGFLKREGRPSDKETLTSRLIDRPIRPLFPDGFRCDTQVVVTCSLGVAHWNSRLPQSVVELADQALYLAKCSGRNRVEVSRQEGLPTRIGAL